MKRELTRSYFECIRKTLCCLFFKGGEIVHDDTTHFSTCNSEVKEPTVSSDELSFFGSFSPLPFARFQILPHVLQSRWSPGREAQSAIEVGKARGMAGKRSGERPGEGCYCATATFTMFD